LAFEREEGLPQGGLGGMGGDMIPMPIESSGKE